MAAWKLVLADDQGTTLCELPTATGVKFEFKRNYYGQCEFTISHADDAAYLLLDCLKNTGIPTLRAYRNGVLRFHGYLAPFTEELEESAAMNLVFRGPFAYLIGDGEGRGVFTSEYDDAGYGADAGAVAIGLIDSYGSNITPVGIDTSYPAEPTVAREMVYEDANVGEAIIELSQMLDGFDFEEEYIEPAVIGAGDGIYLARFRVYARQGATTASALFTYGPTTMANVRSVTRATEAPANRVTAVGQSGARAVELDVASRNKYGRWGKRIAVTSDRSSELDSRALASIRPGPIRTLSFAPEFGLDNCPKPWDDFWLGDSVQFYGRRDSFEEDTALRVNAITVVVDDNGNETAEIPDPQTPGEEAALRATLEGEVVATG